MKVTVQRCDYSIGARKSTRKLTKITETRHSMHRMTISQQCCRCQTACAVAQNSKRVRCALSLCSTRGFIYYGVKELSWITAYSTQTKLILQSLFIGEHRKGYSNFAFAAYKGKKRLMLIFSFKPLKCLNRLEI